MVMHPEHNLSMLVLVILRFSSLSGTWNTSGRTTTFHADFKLAVTSYVRLPVRIARDWRGRFGIERWLRKRECTKIMSISLPMSSRLLNLIRSRFCQFICHSTINLAYRKSQVPIEWETVRDSTCSYTLCYSLLQVAGINNNNNNNNNNPQWRDQLLLLFDQSWRSAFLRLEWRKMKCIASFRRFPSMSGIVPSRTSTARKLQ